MNEPSGNSYDTIAEIYDEDMGLNNPGKDIEFYKKHIKGTEILELGCGTGRVTIPLLKAGFKVTAVDLSRSMIDEFQKKAALSLTDDERSRLTIIHKDMSQINLGRTFSTVICPFCAITYLKTPAEQYLFLDVVKLHLRDKGIFIFDTFVPKFEILCKPNPVEVFDYERHISSERVLKRDKTIVHDLTGQLSHITRKYELFDRDMKLIKRLQMSDIIRYSFKDELEAVLAYKGFVSVNVFSDYGEIRYQYSANKMVFLAQREL